MTNDNKLPSIRNLSPTQLKLTLGTAIGTGIFDIAMHNPSIALASLVFVGGVGYMSEELVEMLALSKERGAVVDAAQNVADHLAPEQEDPYKDQRPMAKLKRIVGIYTPPLEHPQIPASVKASSKDENEDEYQWYDDEDGMDLPAMDSGMFTFSQLLASGFRPTLRKIFLGRLADGTDTFVEAKDLCHVALAGNTGNGKTSLLRLIMAQLCYAGANVALLNPHYMIYDYEHDEDWTPYTPYLERDPLEYVTPDQIAFLLKWVVENTLQKRIQLARVGKPVGKPHFLVIDELPAIAAKRKDVAGYIAEILREGRKYGIYLIVASQDFLVKTTGMEDVGGAARKCYRTACYVGGDLTTANVLLEKQATPIPETELGKGKMMLRCSATRQAVLASVPYCDNAALYLLLGPSTFDPNADVAIYQQDARVNAETPIYQHVNNAVNGSASTPTLHRTDTHLHFPVNVNDQENKLNQAEGTPVNVNVNVDAEKRETIKRMNEVGGIPHNKIAKVVGLDGRHYPTYKAVCKEMGISTEREA